MLSIDKKNRRHFIPALAAGLLLALGGQSSAAPQPGTRDCYSDTWTATDALGRSLPGFAECGAPRPGKYVGIFYFLWLGAHANGGPYDITKILAQDPQAVQKKDSPLWGPMHAFHHWGEPLFGYYRTDDDYVLRKHAQMLADAGVDTVIFDVTNHFTYKQYYMALLRSFAAVRRAGGKTPQVAFLCPFSDPGSVVKELYQDLYAPGLYSDLWFRWKGKPLILADPDMLDYGEGNTQQNMPAGLEQGHTLGQSFRAERPFAAVCPRCPTYFTADAAVTLSLYRQGPKGEQVATKRFTQVADNAWLPLRFEQPLPAGEYYLELSDAKGKVGWWSHSGDVYPRGQAYADGVPCAGDRTLRVVDIDSQAARIRDFFTFRKPQADYFRGPTGPDMWSWLEVYPQHVFKNSRGEKEQMTVGVAQNAVAGRLGAMSAPGALGRSYHNGKTDTRPNAVRYGLNVAEQWQRALKEDPQFIFLTGWNEWIAMRFTKPELPVEFVDQYDEEHSRDIEPMRGGHGDDYYYQMVANIRRFKGVRRPPLISRPKTIRLEGDFSQWRDVAPEFRDDAGDTAQRDHPGYNTDTRYVNHTGRNDFVCLKAARDAKNLYFYARTQAPLTPAAEPRWMLLFIDADDNPRTGWEGYDFVLNRTVKDGQTTLLEQWKGAQGWQPRATLRYRVQGNELMLAVPRAALGLAGKRLCFNFKWTDNIQKEDVFEFTLNGDSAPNNRFNYHYEEVKR